MKKVFSVFLFFITISVYSQQLSADGRCMPEDLLKNTILQGRNEMGNFTITDSDGVTRTLYDELDSGKTILLDLFFTT
jgi:cytochrome oxidase Cu insertion factor (SCO1/SenC/PrrC family)